MSETIAVPLTVGLLLAAAWAGGSTSLLRWGVVGLSPGVLVLVRSEDLLNAVVLVPVAALVAPSVGHRAPRCCRWWWRWWSAGAVLAPWVIRNYETFTPHVFLSSNDGKTLAGANCPTTYQGPLIGYWDYSCLGHDSSGQLRRSRVRQGHPGRGHRLPAIPRRAASAGGRGPGPAGLGPLRPPATGEAGRSPDPQHRLAAAGLARRRCSCSSAGDPGNRPPAEGSIGAGAGGRPGCHRHHRGGHAPSGTPATWWPRRRRCAWAWP